jgi:hypothetical protein
MAKKQSNPLITCWLVACFPSNKQAQQSLNEHLEHEYPRSRLNDYTIGDGDVFPLSLTLPDSS